MEEGTTTTREDQSETTIGGGSSNNRMLDRRRGKDDTDSSDTTTRKKQAWYIRWIKSWGSGMKNDIVKRLPYYKSDWTDAWNYRVIPATWVGC
jgi:hypothetical protein